MNASNARRKAFLPYLTLAVLLLGALTPMPYGYYSVMRWIVCAAFVYLALQAHAANRTHWMWIWVVAAGVYNPLFKVAASRELWTVVNLLTLGLVAYGAWRAARQYDEPTDSAES